MIRILNVLGLVVLWVALVGELSLKSVSGGVLVAVVVLAVSSMDLLGRPHRATFPGLLGFAILYAWELVIANLRVARMVFAARSKIRSAVFLVDTQARTDLERFLLANLNTFTPGSVILDGVEEDRFLVHVAGTGELERTRGAVMDNERRVLWFIR